MLRAEDLDRAIRAAMPGLWRLETEADVIDRVDELNARIDDYNLVTTWERRARLDRGAIVAQWRRFRS